MGEAGSVHTVHDRARDLGGRHALLSEDFFYFGDHPVALPEHLQGLVQRTQGHRSVSNAPHLGPFLDWLAELDVPANAEHGEPAAWRESPPAAARLV